MNGPVLVCILEKTSCNGKRHRFIWIGSFVSLFEQTDLTLARTIYLCWKQVEKISPRLGVRGLPILSDGHAPYTEILPGLENK